MKIIKFITIGLFVVQIYGLTAQVSFYKIIDGVKTVLTEGENVKLNLNNEGKPIENILIEVNVEEFRKKHNFDDILIAFGPPTLPLSQTPRISHTFEEDYIKKKYANVNVLNFYAFKNSEFKEQLGNSSPTSSTYYISASDMSRTFHYRIIGRFKTGTEKYWDEQSKSYKIRDLFESTEIIRSVEVTFEENKTISVNRNYADLIGTNALVEFNGIPTSYEIRSHLNFCADDLAKIEVGFGPVTKQKYKYLSAAIYEIAEAKYQEIKAETDKTKALEIFYAWYDEHEKFCIKDDKDRAEELKLLEKELGEANTVEQKLTLIRAYIKE